MKQVGKPVTGKDFIGRKSELALLMEYIKMGQSVVLIAPRRFGKTSLVLEALSRLQKQKYYIAYIDVFANPTLELLSSDIIKEVLKNHKLDKQFAKAKKSITSLVSNLKLRSVIDDFQFIMDFTKPVEDEMSLILESIDFVEGFALKHNIPMVCAYDEFGDIRKFDKSRELIKVFRSRIQRHTRTTYIFSGSYESVMSSMFVNSRSPFYRLAKIIKLDYVNEEPWIRHLSGMFRKLKYEIPKSYPSDIFRLCKGHPYYLQLAFQQVVLNKTLYGYLPEINILKEIILSSEKDYLEKVWEDVSSNKENIYTLRAIAENPTGIYKKLSGKKINVARAVKNLEGAGILFRNDTGWYISDPFFCYWIQNNL